MTPDLPPLTRGAHRNPEAGLCVLEAAAYLRGLPHSDHPSCVSPILGAFGRGINDALLPARADLEPRLRALVPRLLDTEGRPDIDQRAGLLAADWLCRVYTPTWLRLAGLVAEAEALESAPEVTSWDLLPRAGLDRSREAAARDAARDAGDAAWAAAWAAARAAEDARAAAGAAAWSTAWSTAWATAWAAAWAAEDARDAAWDAAWAALAPTVARLQGSALDLFERMIALWETP